MLCWQRTRHAYSASLRENCSASASQPNTCSPCVVVSFNAQLADCIYTSIGCPASWRGSQGMLIQLFRLCFVFKTDLSRTTIVYHCRRYPMARSIRQSWWVIPCWTICERFVHEHVSSRGCFYTSTLASTPRVRIAQYIESQLVEGQRVVGQLDGGQFVNYGSWCYVGSLKNSSKVIIT